MLAAIGAHSLVSGGINDSGALSGLDIMATIQILLIQDYDSQLKHLANTIKANNKVKAKYRKDIEELQKLNSQVPIKNEDDGLYYTEVPYKTATDFGEINHYAGDYETGTLIQEKDPRHPKKGKIENPYKHFNKFKVEGDDDKHNIYAIPKDSIQSKIELITTRMETFQDQNEMINTQIQSLTNGRKISFETLSNFVSKENETLSTIVRNMKG